MILYWAIKSLKDTLKLESNKQENKKYCKRTSWENFRIQPNLKCFYLSEKPNQILVYMVSIY